MRKPLGLGTPVIGKICKLGHGVNLSTHKQQNSCFLSYKINHLCSIQSTSNYLVYIIQIFYFNPSENCVQVHKIEIKCTST